MGKKLDVCDKSILWWGKTSACSLFEIEKTKGSISDEELPLNYVDMSLLQSVFCQLWTFVLLIYPRASADALLGLPSCSAKLWSSKRSKIAYWISVVLSSNGDYRWPNGGKLAFLTTKLFQARSPFALALKRPIRASKSFVWLLQWRLCFKTWRRRLISVK